MRKLKSSFEFIVHLTKHEHEKSHFSTTNSNTSVSYASLCTNNCNPSRITVCIDIQGGGNGKYALRGAIVTAAFNREGLTLNESFPSVGN